MKAKAFEALALATGLLAVAPAEARQAQPTPSDQAAVGVPLPAPPTQREDDDRLRIRSGGGGDEGPVRRPDLSRSFDPFAPDQTPPPRAPPFDPARPDLSWETDALAGRIVGGARNAEAPPRPLPEPWRLPGRRRAPALADPPPGSAPAVQANGASGTDG